MVYLPYRNYLLENRLVYDILFIEESFKQGDLR